MKKLILIILSLVISLLSLPQIPRDQKIIASEYFINTDPGEGNGIIINTGGTPLWEITVNVQNITLPVGSKIYVRFKSTNGKWSAPRSIQRKPFFENAGSTIEYGEYYINTDPGEGNGHEVNLETGSVNINGLTLARGDKVFVRIQDNMNRWSPARPVTFNFKEIEKAMFVKIGLIDTITMNLSPYNPYSCIYISTYDNLTQSNDSADLLYQTKDKFWSKAKRFPLHIPNAINETTEDNFYFYNYPNPFTDITSIYLNVPEKSFIKIELIGLFGNSIQLLAEEQMSQGKYEVQFDGSNLPNGMYYCQIKLNNRTSTIKLIKQR